LNSAPAERSAYLEQACAGDAALRQQIEALVQAHEQAEDFMEASPATFDFKRTLVALKLIKLRRDHCRSPIRNLVLIFE
jgi:hypothetical protein